MLEIILEKVRILIFCGLGATAMMMVVTVVSFWFEHRKGVSK